MTSGDGLMDLDRLIQSCEFENQQYVKLIEKENQQIEALEKEIEEKQQETLKLEEAITQLDEDTKRAHKQFTLNRDNCESLRKTAVVLMEHEVALNRKLNSIIDNGEKERQEHSGILHHYEGIYSDYMAKYKKFPFADEVEVLQRELNAREQVVTEVEERINKLKLQVEEKQGGSDGNFKDLNKFILKIAEIKVDTQRAVAEKNQFENELREIQSKNSRNEEDEESVMESSNLDDSTHQEANISANDSLGEDMSTMIRMFHNKQDASKGDQTFKRTVVATTSVTPNTQTSTVADALGARSEVPVTKMSEMDISPSLPTPSMNSLNSRRVNSMETETSFIETSSPMETEPSTKQPLQRFVPSTIHDNLNHAPTLGHKRTPSTFVPSQSPSIRMPVMPTLIPRSPAILPRTRATPLVPSLMSPNSQDLQLQSSGGTPIITTSTLNRPSSSNSSAPTDPRLTPKIKHGINSIQTRPLNQTTIPRTPTLLMPSLEPKKDPSPHLPTIQSRAPPRLCLPPPPPPTPDAYRGLDPSRFVSPVQPPASRHQAMQAPAPRQLFITPISAPMVRTSASATGTVSSHFNQHDPEPESVAHKDDEAMGESGNTKSSPGTPKTPKTPKTPNSEESKSPFNLEKHLEAIKMLSTSPGCPLYAQRPMFEESQAGESSPGPFLQSFSTKTSETVFSTPTNKSTPIESKSGSREAKPLFGGMATDDAPMGEPSFNLGGMRNSPAGNQGSFLSLFASGDFQSPANAKSSPQDNFSFNFGQASTPQSSQSDFSFSFGGNSDMDERSPSVFNLF